MYQRGDIKEGMTVRSIDGHKLGKVYAVGDMEFHIEKGLFFPKDYSVRYAEISDLRNGEIILAHGKDSLRAFSDEVPYGSDTIAQREGIGNSRVSGTDSAWMNQGERTGLPFNARPEETVVTSTPLRAEEESARERAMTDDELLHVHDELYGDGHMRTTVRRDDTEGTRKLDLSGENEPKNKRGI
ncbi:hypothetical protein [Archangium violaceum]|uniref:hypothetical protein n=1 Tax=Archangium violaceum TaxID=83451 RepID=UPI0006978EDF|nr:hypothetical protein [Archangium violaceum]